MVCERKTQCDRAHVEGVLLGKRELKKGEGRGSLWGRGCRREKGGKGRGKEGGEETDSREGEKGREGGRDGR